MGPRLCGFIALLGAILGLISAWGMLLVGVLFVDMRSFRSMRYAQEIRYSFRGKFTWRSHQQMNSSFEFFSFQSLAFFPALPRLFPSLASYLSSCSIATPGPCRVGVGRDPSAGERLMASLGLQPALGEAQSSIYMLYWLPACE